jgi:hypothetical protein
MNAAPVWITLFIVIVVGMAVLAIIGAVVWLLVRRPRGGDPSLMACGACGYSVRGVQTTACPECGADLREVGIVRPRASGGSAAWWVVLAVSVVLALFLGLFCLGGLFWARGSASGTFTTPAAPPRVMPTPAPSVAPPDSPSDAPADSSSDAPQP